MSTSCLEKQAAIKKNFQSCSTPHEKYQKIMELGKTLGSLNSDEKIPAHIVSGCQSIVYLLTTFENGKVFFKAESEALISSGLAALLIAAYSGESPETILQCPPSFIEELGLSASLSIGRSNGLASIYLRMKQEALKFLVAGAGAGKKEGAGEKKMD